MRVYHGSYTEIENIDLSMCKPFKDFGRGFYVTKFRHHAENWARVIGERHQSVGVVTEFDFCDKGFALNICKIKYFEEYNEEWLDFVVMNRNKNSEFTHDYDIVEGPVANDKVQNRIKKYLAGKISKADFLEELKYHEETHQICFCTLNSLQTLDYTKKTPHENISDISEPIIETLITNQKIDEMQATDIFYTSNTFAQLSKLLPNLYRKTWQEIYELLKIELNIQNPIFQK